MLTSIFRTLTKGLSAQPATPNKLQQPSTRYSNESKSNNGIKNALQSLLTHSTDWQYNNWICISASRFWCSSILKLTTSPSPPHELLLDDGWVQCARASLFTFALNKIWDSLGNAENHARVLHNIFHFYRNYENETFKWILSCFVTH